MRAEENQTFSLTVSFGYFIGMPVCMLIAALSIFFLCLTSRWAYIILDSLPFQFLGEISYCLYLLHTLIIEWLMKESQYYWVNNDVTDYDAGAYYVFLIFTPILIVLSWAATKFIDGPCTNLVRDLDINCRANVPKPRGNAKPVK
jgi:peptidoglycan/LPS O-acetylase OafA/YrhL